MPAKTKSIKSTKPKTTRPRKKVVRPAVVESAIDYGSEDVMREYQPRASWGSAIVGIIIILMVAGSLGAVWVWRTSSIDFGQADSDSQSDNYQIPLGITVNQPTDPLAGWGTYSSAEPQFTLRYPADWQVDPAVASTSSSTLTRLINRQSQDVFFEILTSDHQGTIADYLEELDELTAGSFEGEPSVEVINEQPVSISSWPAIIRSQKLLAADLNQVVAYIKMDDHIISFSLTAPVVDEVLANIYNQMLSTLSVVGDNLPATDTATSTAATSTTGVETDSTDQ